ncbi:DUF1990 family protein [Microbacterium sp. SLBN-146]|uniref:DUF1990 family protein n=1 Tax=Microbacterium sp. SLBN-146 TaxID=2768457 RepID=UPI0011680C4F|nr:DUF1990 family protein [Microbacterium sp. SLBN-146]TQJ31520.1 uncharacterized protein (UPF0548 family) [Microbacterium sp. SLBN-146]
MVSSFSVVTRAGVPVEELFDVSLSIGEHVSSMAHTGEAAVGGVTSGTIGLGETVTWRARHFGIRFTMSSRITSLDRPHRFVDEQVRGPFRSFHHEHAFARDGDASVMTDTLTIGSPILGRVAERAILVPYLRRLIRRRNQHLLASLGFLPRTDPRLEVWPAAESAPFRRTEVTTRLGRGQDLWERASRDVVRWKVKTESGFTVDDPRRVTPGVHVTVTARVAGIMVREPVEVAEVVDTGSRVGFSYRTLPGHPVSGEEAFIVHRDGDDVFLTIRSLTAPASSGPWRVLHPALRVAQVVARRRYLRALR